MTLLDEKSLIKTKQWTVRGEVPPVLIKAEKIANKKITTVGGLGNTLELLMIDIDDLRTLLAQTLAAAATINSHAGSAKAGSKETYFVQIQGEFCEEIKQILI